MECYPFTHAHTRLTGMFGWHHVACGMDPCIIQRSMHAATAAKRCISCW